MKIKKRIVAIVLTLLLLQNSISAFASGMGKYQINVVDNIDTSNKISGAEFNVLSKGSVVERVTTDGSGVAKMELPNGSYELEQVSTAGGYYITDETISFTVDSKKDEGIYIANMQESVAAGGYAAIVGGSQLDDFYVTLTLENGLQNERPGKFYVFTKEYAENVRDMKPEDIYDSNNILGVYETNALGVLRTVDSEALTSDICREYDGDPAQCVNGKIPRPYARKLENIQDNDTPYPIAYVFVEDGKGPSQVEVTEIGNDDLKPLIHLETNSGKIKTDAFWLKIGNPEEGRPENGVVTLMIMDKNNNEIAFSRGSDGPISKVVETTGGDEWYFFEEELPKGTRLMIYAYNEFGHRGSIPATIR